MDWATRLKTLAKAALCTGYKYSGALAMHEALRHAAGRTGMAVLLFHRVTDEIPEDGLTVGTARFRQICAMLRRGFRVVPLAEVVRITRGGGPLPRRTVAITFDDCYRDNLAAAHTLAESGLPATFFLPAGYVGSDRVFPWDQRLPARLPHLGWEDVREIVRLGFDVGSHTVSHPNLAALSHEEARREIRDSKKLIEDRVGRAVRWFAYPFGDPEHFRPDQLPLVEEAGYEACLSGFGGMIYRGCTGPILPREPVPYFHSVRNLELHLTGCLHWVYAAKRDAYRKVLAGAETLAHVPPAPVGAAERIG